MNFEKKLALTITSTACILTSMMAPVSAAKFKFSYSGGNVLNPNDVVTASGILTTSAYDPATNSYEIIDITGTRNGQAIDGLLASGTFLDNNNLLFTGFPKVDEFGFAYIIGETSYNVFYTYDYVEIGQQGFFTGYPLTSFSITPIPESSLIIGILSVTALVTINKINARSAHLRNKRQLPLGIGDKGNA
ncbi:hypothetical protein [Anabaena azotica]|uniref:PEP-CTERM sorting domain-containing protein n=1 Tax=Anabaena azotica FACHB-119 TaxID=947527 RepID=A0ABR8D005_9NOST|nr:hypothetical protein [Anabaena azotica]MBD2500529.1 hypothetical protein [Anabaena azotica FACHB-119]